MKRIAENNIGADRLDIPWQHALNGAVSSHRHEGGSRNATTVKSQLTCSGLTITGLNVKFHRSLTTPDSLC